jgi:VIT1/CCC1 family predicted Fe2+/Mn2+ transporter
MNKKLKAYFSDFVFGSVDGLVTTFAVVSGVMGAGLSATVILILGFANLFADGFSMAASNYLSTKSENDMGQNTKNAFGAALATFVAFILIGFIPLISFVFDFGSINYQVTIILTAVAFSVIGYIKGSVTGKNKIWSALQTLAIGTLAALIAFYVGLILAAIVN